MQEKKIGNTKNEQKKGSNIRDRGKKTTCKTRSTMLKTTLKICQVLTPTDEW